MPDFCKTKYPILLVHGVGFHSGSGHSYWGRVPGALREGGAVVFETKQDGWGGVERNALALYRRVREVCRRTGSQKVNLIAHSKGGIEARYMISTLGGGQRVASLTTVSTPHHGSKTIDYLYPAPNAAWKAVAFCANLTFWYLGDRSPDFLLACTQFTTRQMLRFNEANPDAPGVYYQSYAAAMKAPWSDPAIWFPNLVVGILEGENDGLVTTASARWSNFKGVLRSPGLRGVSHVDAVDRKQKPLSRRRDRGVGDVADFYCRVAADLARRGL